MRAEPLEGFVAMEGVDYSGKESHSKLTKSKLEKIGRAVLMKSFPDYDVYSGQMVRRYLAGEFGDTIGLHPKLAAYLYEADRALSGREIRQFAANGGVVIADRFTGSNMAHQGAKLEDQEERRAFYEACMTDEFIKLGVPQPTSNFVLLVGKEFMANTINQRLERGEELDAHERDIGYQMRVIDAYEELCEVYPRLFTPIDCMADANSRRPFKVINDELFELIKEVV